jgi:c(7)-type cytochrome triheme protein
MKKLIVLAIALIYLSIPLKVYAEKVGGGELTFSPKNAARVVFSHEKHVMGKGLNCSGCHYQIFQMAHGANKIDMTKITKGEFCGKCHNGQKAFDVNDNKNCSHCHI